MKREDVRRHWEGFVGDEEGNGVHEGRPLALVVTFFILIVVAVLAYLYWKGMFW